MAVRLLCRLLLGQAVLQSGVQTGFLASAYTPTLQATSHKSALVSQRRLSVHYDTNGFTPEDDSPFFLRRALKSDLGFASKILADGFYGDKFWLMQKYEQLEILLNLEDTFPHPFEEHEMWVACERSTGKVWGFVEVDNRPPKPPRSPESVINPTPRPYMYNLAVDAKCRRLGLATALVRQVEKECQEEWLCPQIHLRARKGDPAAVGLYESLGYEVVKEEIDPKDKNKLLLWMRKDLVAPAENPPAELRVHKV